MLVIDGVVYWCLVYLVGLLFWFNVSGCVEVLGVRSMVLGENMLVYVGVGGVGCCFKLGCVIWVGVVLIIVLGFLGEKFLVRRECG